MTAAQPKQAAEAMTFRSMIEWMSSLGEKLDIANVGASEPLEIIAEGTDKP